MASQNPLADFFDQLFIRHGVDLGQGDQRAKAGAEFRETGKSTRAWPGVKRSVHRHRQNGDSTAARQRAEARLQRANLSVEGAGPLRKNQDHLSPLQSLERLLDAAEAEPISIDGNRLQVANERPKQKRVEQRVPCEEVDLLPEADPDEHGVEIALVVGADQGPAVAWKMLASLPTKAKEDAGDQPERVLEQLVTGAFPQRSSHATFHSVNQPTRGVAGSLAVNSPIERSLRSLAAQSPRIDAMPYPAQSPSAFCCPAWGPARRSRTACSSKSTTSSTDIPSVRTWMASSAATSAPTPRFSSSASR